VDQPPAGLQIPLEVAAARLRDYAPFLAPPDRALLPDLAAGRAVLGSSSAALRGLVGGGLLEIDGRRIVVAGVVPDEAVGAHEVFVARRTASSLGLSRERYLLVDPAPGVGPDRVARRIRALLPAGQALRIRGPGETPFFRHGDAVLPPVRLKELFGEFAAAPRSDGWLRMEHAWVAEHIVTARVPILGPVTCNEAILPQLRGALGDIEAEGLARRIDLAHYGGCYAGRFANRDTSAGLSHHSWGVAIDLNVSTNRLGAAPQIDPRVVAAFERWGFTWGGRWLVPDGMHFEFARFGSG
jgi:hypothetical protein